MILLLTSAWKASSSRKSRIQESLCPHQGPTHQPRSQTAWHPGLPSCGGHCSCPVLAAALPHIAHPFPEYMRPRFLWMEYYCRFFLCQRAAPPAQAPEVHKMHKMMAVGGCKGVSAVCHPVLWQVPPYVCCVLSSAAPVDTGAASFAFDNVKRCVRRALHFVLLMRHGCGRRYNRCPKIAPLSERPAAAWFCSCRSFSVLPCIDQELDL